MKYFVSLFVFLLCIAWYGPHVADVSQVGCSTPSLGANMTEGFEDTGYENSWTESSTPDEDHTRPGTLTNGCSESFYVNANGAAIYAYYNHGSVWDVDTTALTIIVYLYITTGPDAGEDFNILTVGENTDPDTNKCAHINLTNDAGTLKLAAGGVSTSNTFTVSTGTWYKLELYLATTAANSTFDVNDAGAQTFTRSAYDVQYMFIGAPRAIGAGENGQLDFDLFYY